MEECLSPSVGHCMYFGFSYLFTRQERKQPQTFGREGGSPKSTGISLGCQAVTICHRLSTRPKPLVKVEFQILPENISHLRNEYLISSFPPTPRCQHSSSCRYLLSTTYAGEKLSEFCRNNSEQAPVTSKGKRAAWPTES